MPSRGRVRLLRGAGPERAARATGQPPPGHEHRAGDRGAAAAQRDRVGRRAARNAWSPTRWRPSNDCCRTEPADGRPLLRADSAFYGTRRCGRDPGRRRGVGHRPPGQAGQGRHRRHRRGTPGRRSSTPTRSTTRTPTPGSRAPRSPRSPFTAFASKKQGRRRCPGRLVVRRIPDLNPQGQATGRPPCSTPGGSTRSSPPADPDSLDTVAADKTHRGHAIIEQVNADLKNSALAHLPSGKFCANAAWLVLACMAFNLTRAAASLDRPDPGEGDHRARSAANSSPCRPGSRPQHAD